MPNNHDDSEIMTVAEVAAYLQLAEKTILRMAQSGRIPAAKIASQWRFLRPVVRDWVAGQMQMEALQAPPRGSALRASEVIRPSLVTLSIRPGPKEQVLRELIVPAAETGFAADPDRLLASLLERERMMTTAVGHGVALPHPRRPLGGMFAEPALVVGVCREGTAFGAIDDRLVHVLMLVCSTRDSIHLQLMATAAWLAQSDRFADDLCAVATVDEALAVMARHAERSAPGAGRP
ncbi:MAG: PTS transporter subunit EIIA [Planctomycetes bacterium]|nr:PTS transporter subunit EIIA [Planctomycetota bacterium]